MRQKPPQKADKTDQIRSDFRIRAADQIRSEAKKTDQIQIRTGQIRSDRARRPGAGPAHITQLPRKAAGGKLRRTAGGLHFFGGELR
jgi:hypothetical protein